MPSDILKAPFPAFGGKSKVAPLVWSRLGDVDNYIEPFCNSCAVLLQRPHAPRIETVNDWDCYIANFWRATKENPELVAEHADNPVNEADLHARHRWLVLGEYAAEFRDRMRTDPHYYDPVVAGWWVWGACCWIGPGWCQTPKQGKKLSESLPKLGQYAGKIVPECSSNPTQGLRTGRPQLADAYSLGRGVNGTCHAERGTKRPIISNSGSGGHGVHADGDCGLHGTCAERRQWLLNWFIRLRDRLRSTRVCCGDWKRVCDSPSVTTRLGVTGILLDAPYKTTLDDGKSNRADGLYANDRDQNVNELVDRVIAYCLERGNDPNMCIAACCYEGEGYEVLAARGWTVESWKASGGYGNNSGKVNDNAARERIWFSPHCKPAEQLSLFKTLDHEPHDEHALAL